MKVTEQTPSATPAAAVPANSFDLCRVSRAQEAVNLHPSVIRGLHKQGLLQIYWCGRVSLFSKSELATVIKSTAAHRKPRKSPNPYGRRGKPTEKIAA